jgi:histidinol-phosphate/aromatic aminotransferase/cobyric acid decarboxylase-like protein
MVDGFEKDRFASRLASIPGVQPMPSIGDWILLQVEQPAELARRVNRRLAPGVMSVPRNLAGTVRIHVGDPKANERLLKTLRDLVA